MSLPLDLQAHLMVTLGTDHFVIRAEHDHITMHITRLRTGLALVRQLPGRRARADFLHQLQAGLTFAALNVDVQVAGRLIARLGVHARPGLVSRCLGFGPVELHLWRLGWAWWKRGA